jgi:ATP-dependent Clp protease protease subunit
MYARRVKKRKRFTATEVESDSDEEKDSAEIIYIDNHIWFYGEINTRRCMLLQNILHILREEQKKLTEGKIVIHLQTTGGCVFAGFNMFDFIQDIQRDVPVEVIIEGQVASSGTLLMLGADTRIMRGHSVVLIHEISGGYWGKFSHLKDEMRNMRLLSKRLIRIYKKRTKMPIKTIRSLLAKDIYFDAEQALQNGFATAML